jgi:hypothetical protein
VKIEYDLIDHMTITAFAELHDLTMTVGERDYPGLPRYWARFKHSETRLRGVILESTHGNGQTPAEAVDDYAHKISGKLLVVNAYQVNRREIQVPQLDGRGAV